MSNAATKMLEAEPLMILTDAKGVPFCRPSREDFTDVVEYMRAVYAYNDKVAAYAVQEFSEAFAKNLRDA